ncbi:MAG: polysaccharide biosynthesis/export family protein [Polyangiaceae bacterium]
MWLLMTTLLMAACVSGPVKPPDLPPAVHSTTLGVGDILEIRILSAKDLATEYQVAPDGTVSLPYIGAMEIVGLEPHQIEARVRQALIDGQYYTNPRVSVIVRAYRSKRVNIAGQVKKPDSYPLEPGMGLLKLISLAGGFTDIADEDRIIIQRQTPNGVKVVTVSYDDIRDGRIPDVPLQSGDYVEVRRSII